MSTEESATPCRRTEPDGGSADPEPETGSNAVVEDDEDTAAAYAPPDPFGVCPIDRVVSLDLADVPQNAEFQPRVALIDNALVARYAEVIENGSRLPRPCLFELTDEVGTPLVLVDGHQTVEATRRSGAAAIEVEVRRGTRMDAMLHAARANVAHGQALTSPERQAWFGKVVADCPHLLDWADTEIAPQFGVSSKTIGRWARRHRAERPATRKIRDRSGRVVSVDTSKSGRHRSPAGTAAATGRGGGQSVPPTRTATATDRAADWSAVASLTGELCAAADRALSEEADSPPSAGRAATAARLARELAALGRRFAEWAAGAAVDAMPDTLTLSIPPAQDPTAPRTPGPGRQEHPDGARRTV
jgi:hypothetical protein